MSSNQQLFANTPSITQSIDETEWVSVKPNKKGFGKQSTTVTKQVPITEPIKLVSKVISQQPVDMTMTKLEETVEHSKSNQPTYKPRGPPQGIIVRLDKEWKDWVRSLVPNKGTVKSDKAVMDEIANLRGKPDVKLTKFKNIVCMIFHQALKTNRNTLIQHIIKRWKDSRFDIIELIDSTYDNCKPIFQACWSGSLDCIQLIVASDQTGEILKSVHPSKPTETIMDTLRMGMNRALIDNPSNVQIFHRRYTECIDYIQASIRRMVEIDLETSGSVCNSVDLELCAEIERKMNVGSSMSDKVEDFVASIATLYLDDQNEATKYFLKLKELASPQVSQMVENRLGDEGIEL